GKDFDLVDGVKLDNGDPTVTAGDPGVLVFMKNDQSPDDPERADVNALVGVAVGHPDDCERLDFHQVDHKPTDTKNPIHANRNNVAHAVRGTALDRIIPTTMGTRRTPKIARPQGYAGCKSNHAAKKNAGSM